LTRELLGIKGAMSTARDPYLRTEQDRLVYRDLSAPSAGVIEPGPVDKSSVEVEL